ncbi:MAG: DUF4388 domain-containing protein [Chloroflexota bacterium]
MPLQGSLPDFTVVDVLNLLSSSAKTGVVRFTRGRGGITQTAALYFRDGRPVAAETEGIVGRDALELLCSWDGGSFSYHDGATSPRENLDLTVASLLEEAKAAQEEWQEIWLMLHGATAIVRLAADLPAGVERVEIGRTEWKLLTALNAPQTVMVLAQRAGGGLPAYRMLRKLAEDGLLNVDARG